MLALPELRLVGMLVQVEPKPDTTQVLLVLKLVGMPVLPVLKLVGTLALLVPKQVITQVLKLVKQLGVLPAQDSALQLVPTSVWEEVPLLGVLEVQVSEAKQVPDQDIKYPTRTSKHSEHN